MNNQESTFINNEDKFYKIELSKNEDKFLQHSYSANHYRHGKEYVIFLSKINVLICLRKIKDDLYRALGKQLVDRFYPKFYTKVKSVIEEDK